jgi:hypothetical protein
MWQNLCKSILFALFFLVSCQSRPEYYKEKARGKMSELSCELNRVESLDDLLQRGDRLKVLFNEMVDVIIEAKLYQKKSGRKWEFTAEELENARELQFELERLYKIPGASFLIEKYQQEAMIRLDAFQKKNT